MPTISWPIFRTPLIPHSSCSSVPSSPIYPSIPPSGPAPVYNHVSIIINECHLTDHTLNTLIHRTTDYKTGIDQGGFITPMDALTKPLG